ncbi:TRAP transporter small permease subunit [Acuticoccus sp.]|uniref:TRAP transporter small permease subunit n=1 Tax=Acuticoccus sp. TaxID=1904378 RepID=UPI003B529066
MFAIARFITSTNRFIGKVLAWLIIPLFAFLFADVVMRYFVGSPAIWTSELATLMFGGYAILAGGYLMAERGHVNVDIIYGRFSRRRKAMVDVATSFLFFLFMIVLLWQGWSLAADSIERWERTMSAWKGPVWPVKAAIPVAAALLLAQGIVRVWADVRVLLGLPVPEDVFGKQPDEEMIRDKAARGEIQE